MITEQLGECIKQAVYEQLPDASFGGIWFTDILYAISDGTYIFARPDGYHCVCLERGVQKEALCTTSERELLYYVVKQIAFEESVDYATECYKKGEIYRKAMFESRIEIMSKFGEDFKHRCEEEVSKVLEEHPYVDGGMFTGISIRGRVAYLVCSLARMIASCGYNVEDWKLILDVLSELTTRDILDEWLYKTAEYLPDSVLEDTLDDAEYITAEEQAIGQKLYSSCPECITKMVYIIFEVGTSDLYSRIINNSPHTIGKVQEGIELMKQNNVDLVPVEPFMKYKISEGQGWGNQFEFDYRG